MIEGTFCNKETVIRLIEEMPDDACFMVDHLFHQNRFPSISEWLVCISYPTKSIDITI